MDSYILSACTFTPKELYTMDGNEVVNVLAVVVALGIGAFIIGIFYTILTTREDD